MRPSALGASYPFAALVGQDALRQALLLGAVDPSLGGVLIRGEKGTAKSTAARALAALLPPLRVVEGCPHRCDPDRPWPDCPACGAILGRGEVLPAAEVPTPHVDLPLGATEDRVLGTLDLNLLLKEGNQALRPGLLADAHRGVLYVDEVNLLSDHLVDALLDAASSGVNTVQRDGVAARHPSRFLLIGSMNAEEGELRPQLRDRFGLAVEVAAPTDPAPRAEVVRRRLAFEADPAAFAARWLAEDRALGERVAHARAALPGVAVPDGLLDAIARLCLAAGVDGLRADIALFKASRALAALDGRGSVRRDDLRTAARLVLPHRRRKSLRDNHLSDNDLDRMLGPGGAQDEPNAAERPPRQNEADHTPPPARNEANGHPHPPSPPRPGPDPPGARNEADEDRSPGEPGSDPGPLHDGQDEPNAGPIPGAPDPASEGRNGSPDRVAAVGDSGPVPRLGLDPTTRLAGRATPGRHALRGVGAGRGPAVRSARDDAPRELAVDATVRAAARRAGATGGALPPIERGDLHARVRRAEAQALVVFVVDTSGSMGARRRAEAVKGAVLDLLGAAYRRRDRVAVITARGPRAEVALPPTRGVDAAEAALRLLPTGGRTPLAHALGLAADLVAAEGRAGACLVVVLTDGRANVPLPDADGDPWAQALAAGRALAEAGASGVVFDTEEGFGRLGRAAELAEALGADHLPLARFAAGEVAGRLDRAADAPTGEDRS